MTRFDWNGLRRDDVVFVHRPSVTPRSVVRGTVKFVSVRGRRGNDVGIRVGDGDQQVDWPFWLAVHREPAGVAGTCWRCDAVTRGEAS